MEDIEQRIRQLEDEAFAAQHEGYHDKAIGFATSALDLARQHFGEDHIQFAAVLHVLAVLYDAEGKSDQAIPLLERALVIYRATPAEDNPLIATSLRHLATFNQAVGDYARAEALYLQALEITQRVLGEEDPETIALLKQLAALYHRMGNETQAEEYSQRAGENREPEEEEGIYELAAKEPWATPQFASELLGLAYQYISVGDFDQAWPPLRQALAIYRRVQDQENISRCLHGLAIVYHQKRDYPTAEPLYQQACRVDRAAHKGDHPDTATILHDLARLYHDRGDNSRAELCYQQAVEIFERVGEESLPAFPDTLYSLADLYHERRDYSQALSYYRRALALYEEMLGKDDRHVTVILSWIADVHIELGEFAEAEQILQGVLRTQRRTLGESHADVASTLHLLAEVSSERGEYDVAESYLRESLEIKKATAGDAHPDYARGLQLLAVLQESRGAYTEAEKLYRQAEEIVRTALGETHPYYAAIVGGMAGLYQKMGDYTRAEMLFQQALDIRQKALGEAHPDIATSLNNLGIFYRAIGKFAQAEPYYQRALKITRALHGETHPYVAASMNNLAILYQEMGDYARAESYSQQASNIVEGEDPMLKDDTLPAWPRSTQRPITNNQKDGEASIREALRPLVEEIVNALWQEDGQYMVLLLRELIERTKNSDDDRWLWAAAQQELGDVLVQLPAANYEENLEQVIIAYQAALDVYSPSNCPTEWATIQNNLGNAYWRRTRGQPADNMERAIVAYNSALQVRTRTADPYGWARTQNNLGNVYSQRVRGTRAENEKLAIVAFKAALQVHTVDMYPDDYAMDQTNLGLTYQERISGIRAENLDQAMVCFLSAMLVYTLTTSPLKYRRLVGSLADAFRARIEEAPPQMREQVIAGLTPVVQALRKAEEQLGIHTYSQPSELIDSLPSQSAKALDTPVPNPSLFADYLRAIPLITLINMITELQRPEDMPRKVELLRAAILRADDLEPSLQTWLHSELEAALNDLQMGDVIKSQEDATKEGTSTQPTPRHELPEENARDQSTSSQTPLKRVEEQEAAPPPASLQIWFMTPAYKEQRRFLEAHPELLSPATEEFLETMLEDFIDHSLETQQAVAFTPEQMVKATQDLRNRLYIIRYIRAHGNTIAAIQMVYADLGGGYVLEYPYWLDTTLDQINALKDVGDPQQIAEARVDLLRRTIDYIQKDGSEVAPETLAELQFTLAKELLEYPSAIRMQEYDAAIDVYKTILQFCTYDRYPFQYAKAQGSLGDAYSNRLTGDLRANQEEAIACYNRALQVYTLDAFSEKYALTQFNLACVYHRRVEGEQQANLKEAVACYTTALQVYTLEAFPELFASIQFKMGDAYSELLEDRQANLEEAIACHYRTLQVYILEDFPEDYAKTQLNLGTIYVQRISGERGSNIEKSIACYKRALQVFTQDVYPKEYGMLQANLGSAYEERSEGKREENLEEAIACYKRALQIRTLEAFPEGYAKLQFSMGLIYMTYQEGRQVTKLEEAIACFSCALQVYTPNRFPKEYANIQMILSPLYMMPRGGEQEADIEEAIACCNRALQYYTPETSRPEYARLQSILASAYSLRVVGERQANLEEVIACCTRALQFFTLTSFPAEYANTQDLLGLSYRERSAGEQSDNLEKAIDSYTHALLVYTADAFPKNYAKTQCALGDIYLHQRLKGERRMNVETAITCYTLALQIFTRDAFPEEYAETSLKLGFAYGHRLEGKLRANLEKAIVLIKEALEIYTPETFPFIYAAAQSTLGLAYILRIEGERRANIESAIYHLSQALRGKTRKDFPDLYAQTQISLAQAYESRIMGEKYANLEEAIACLSQALEIFTLDVNPLGYARAQMFLANIYGQRLVGDRSANLEEAIACYKRALQVCTPENDPEGFAIAQNNLGNIYAGRIAGERSANQEEAIAYYNRALQYRTVDDLPKAYGMTMHNLGHVYSARILGERHANLAEAIACYNRALQVFTLDAFPLEHRWVQLDLADDAEDLQDWETAHEAYKGALAAEEELFAWGAGTIGRDAILKEGRNAALRDGFALTRLSRIAEAAVAVEQGRARGLAEALALRATNPLLIHNDALRERYEYALKRFTTVQAVLNAPIRADFDPDTYTKDPPTRAKIINQTRRIADRERTAAYHQAKEELDAVVAEIRATQGTADFFSTTLDATTILQASGQCGQAHALVYLVSTTRGGFAVAALSANSKLGVEPHFAAIDLPRLNDFFVDDLIGSTLERETNVVLVCSFADAQAGNGFDRLLSDWEGPTCSERLASLHAACITANKHSTLDAAAQEMLTFFPLLAQIADKQLDQLSSSEQAILAGTFGRLFLQHELKRCLPALADAALRPLINWLRDEGVVSVTLVPCGALAAFPLLAAEVAPGKVMSDLLVTSVAPSARSLLYKEQKVVERTCVYALGNPHPTPQDLKWGEAEAHILMQLAHELGLSSEAKVRDEATRDWLIDALHKGTVVDASCHGYFNIDEPLQSSLRLAQQEVITLGDMLNYNVDLRGLRLLVLSACQTAILDLRQGARDEVRSLAAGMLQAGAKAVLASLWPVDDKATYLLITRFAQEWFPNLNVEPPAAALVRAQNWLRCVTNRELQEWQATTYAPPFLEERPLEKMVLAAENTVRKQELQLGSTEQSIITYETSYRYSMNEAEILIRSLAVRRNKPDDCFYADPIYWAGFQITGW